MSIYQNFPDEGSTLDLNFASSRTLDPRITFARTSIGTFMDDNGLIVTASAGIPRFNHVYNGSSIESVGLLIEESRTNLVTFSEDYSNNNFNSNIVITTNTITSPDGATSADTLTANITGGSNTCCVDKNFNISASTDYTYSVFLKAGTSSKSTINMYFSGGTFREAVLQITWGTTPSTVLTSTAGTTATSSLTPYPNGWYRASITLNSGNNSTGGVSRIYVRDQGTSNVTGQTVYAWGHQVEQGSFATSYIFTRTITVARSAENVYIDGTNFTSWYNQSVGTILCIARYTANNTTNQTAWSLYNSPSGAVRQMMSSSSGTNRSYIQAEYPTGTYPVSMENGSSIDRTTNVKVVCAFKTDDFAISQNGTTVSTDTSGTMSNHTTLYLGATTGTTWMLNGSILQLTYYPKRLTNTEIQTLSL